MLGGSETYCEHYHNNIELIEAKEMIIMRNADMVDQAVEKYQQDRPPTHIWDEIAPETEHAEADATDEGVQEDKSTGDNSRQGGCIFREPLFPRPGICSLK